MSEPRYTAEGCQNLVYGIIGQAVKDIVSDRCNAQDKKSAYRFLNETLGRYRAKKLIEEGYAWVEFKKHCYRLKKSQKIRFKEIYGCEPTAYKGDPKKIDWKAVLDE